MIRKFVFLLLLSCGFVFSAQAQTVTPASYFAYTQTFLSSGTGTIPASVKMCQILAVGGGSSGAGGGTIASGGSGSGGGSGGTGVKARSDFFLASALSTLSYTVTVGAGGSTAAAGAAGNVGGNTTVTFGSLVYTGYGAATPTATPGVSGGTSTGGEGGGSVFLAAPVAGNIGASVLYYNAISSAGVGSTALGVATTSNTRIGPSPGGSGGALNAGVATGGSAGGAIQSPWTPGASSGTGGTAGGGNGGNGTSNGLWPISDGGTGGGGGGGNSAGLGGNGGAGAQPGGGGGGGGSGTTGGGTGGAGGGGALWIGCN